MEHVTVKHTARSCLNSDCETADIKESACVLTQQLIAVQREHDVWVQSF